jgi:hypothetical protein
MWAKSTTILGRLPLCPVELIYVRLVMIIQPRESLGVFLVFGLDGVENFPEPVAPSSGRSQSATRPYPKNRTLEPPCSSPKLLSTVLKTG